MFLFLLPPKLTKINVFGSLFYDAFSVTGQYSVEDRVTNDDE
jgi:hypothetical protein